MSGVEQGKSVRSVCADTPEVDRLITELEMTPLDAYRRICKIVEQVYNTV